VITLYIISNYKAVKKTGLKENNILAVQNNGVLKLYKIKMQGTGNFLCKGSCQSTFKSGNGFPNYITYGDQIIFGNKVQICYLLIYLSRYLDQKTAKGPFRSSIQAVTTNLTTQMLRQPS